MEGLEELSPDMKEVISLASELIRFESDKDNQEARDDCFAFITEWLQGEDVELVITKEKNPLTNQDIQSVYAKHKDNTEDEVLLVGHYDIIHAVDQFSPRVEDGWLYGRGSGDMKAGVAIAMLLFKKYKNVSLLITGDEELGSQVGAPSLMDALKPSCAIAIEPTGLCIVTKQKGGTWVRLVAEAPGGHASRPWTSFNAIDMLLDVYRLLQKRFPRPEQEAWTSTTNIGGMFGGEVKSQNGKLVLGPANSLATHAEMKLDNRLTDDVSHEAFYKILQECVDAVLEKINKTGIPGHVITIKPPETRVAHLITQDDNPIVQKLAAAYETATSEKANIDVEHAASDARFFTEKNIPAIVFGPVSENHHTTNERASISSLEAVFKVLDAFCK